MAYAVTYGMRSSLLVVAPLLLLAGAAAGSLRSYDLGGDESSHFTTGGTVFRPGSVSGHAVILDADDGMPALLELDLHFEGSRVLPGGDFASIPGTTVSLDWIHQLSPAPDQTGAGSSASSISWGALTGWTQTGRLVCETHCPGGCGGSSTCVFFVGFEGTGPSLPLAATAFDTDPWSFAPDGSTFQASSVEIVSLGAGAVTENLVWRGVLQPAVPAFPALGVAIAGALLVAAGARALRRRGAG